MTDDRINQIKQRAEKATPGPWIRTGALVYGPEHPNSQHKNKRVFIGQMAVGSNRRDPLLFGGDGSDMHGDGDSDAEFIAHAREDVPALLSEVDKLKSIENWNTCERELLDKSASREKELIDETVGLSADRDRWKARCEKMIADRCDVCVHRNKACEVMPCVLCIENDAFEFDEARFAQNDGA